MLHRFIWDYKETYPVAEIIDADSTNTAATSFEADGNGGWNITSPVRDTLNYLTGRKCYQLANGPISKGSLSTAKVYTLAYRTTNSAPFSITGTQGTPRQGKTINGWGFYLHEITGVTSISISGSGLIDELRLYPSGARLTSFTYNPGVGITSACDATGKITYFEYDDFNRLALTRDEDGNILEKNDYAYQAIEHNCTSTAANWQQTGVTRCQQGGTNNNYTGQQEREERDLNVCSGTYNQVRWVTTGTVTACAPVSNCTAQNQRVVNGACQTAAKTFIYQVYNNGQWQCKYYYQWTDGYKSPEYTATGVAACEVD